MLQKYIYFISKTYYSKFFNTLKYEEYFINTHSVVMMYLDWFSKIIDLSFVLTNEIYKLFVRGIHMYCEGFLSVTLY